MSPPPQHPRELACLRAGPGAPGTGGAAGPVGDGGGYFPQSVASGDPGPDGVVLWTRAVDPDEPGAELRLGLQVARDEHFRRLVLEVEGLCTAPASDHTLKVRLAGLEPRTHYHYRFVLERRGRRLGSPVGRTRTGGTSHGGLPIHFVVVSYEDLLGQEGPTWQRLLGREEDPDFILFTGESPSEPEESRDAPLVHSVSRYRDLYRTYRSNPFLKQLHARYPFMVLRDAAPGGAGGMPEHRRNAERAFLDYLPVEDRAVDGPEPGACEAAGSNLRLLVSGESAVGGPRRASPRSAGAPPGLRPRRRGGAGAPLRSAWSLPRRP